MKRRRRFRKEGTVLARLSHPHIASLFDCDSSGGVDFLVMELVVGPTLEQEVRQGPLAEMDVVRLGSQLARGLVAAHEVGVIHRDLKPSNLQLTSDVHGAAPVRQVRLVALVAENVRRYSTGLALLNVVDKERGY